MPYLIQRIVPQENLLIRPRVSHRISELVFDHLNIRVLRPLGIMQSSQYSFTIVLSFNKGAQNTLRTTYRSPYSKDGWHYLPQKGFRIFNKTQKVAHLTAYGEHIDERLAPPDYSLMVFEMLADFLLYNFKSIDKDKLDQAWSEFNFLQLDELPFPAPFEEQQYVMDKGKYMTEWSDFLNKRDDKWIVVKDAYVSRFGF